MRDALKVLGTILWICLVLLLGVVGFNYSKWRVQVSRDRATLDRAVSTGGIDQLEIVNGDAGTNRVLKGEEAQVVLAKFAATNRLPWSGPAFLKLYFAGNASFNGVNARAHIGYIPEYNAASYGEYYFQLKGSNDLRQVFEWWRTNAEAALSR